MPALSLRANHSLLAAFVMCGLLGLLACGDLTYDEVAPGVVPDSPTYETDIVPLLERTCIRCHSASRGPGHEPLLDSRARAADEACESLEEFTSGNMPPGGMDMWNAREALTFERWVTNTLGQSGCDDRRGGGGGDEDDD